MRSWWRRFWYLLGELDLLEYLIGGALAAIIEGFVFWSAGYPIRLVLACVVFALTSGMFICCLIEMFFYDHN